MNPGDLRNRIQIKELTTARNEYNEPIEEWVLVKEVWAAINPALGRNYYAADQTQTDAKTKIVTRYHTGIKREMRIYYSDKIYDIIDIQDVKMRHEELVIYCSEVTVE